MSLSGSFSKYPVSSVGLICEWSGSQNIIENYTKITLNVYLSYYQLELGSREGSVSINGEEESFTTNSINDYSAGQKKKLIKTYTKKVYHNADGTKNNVSLSATWTCQGAISNEWIDTITASKKVNLDSIDRSSPVVSCSISNIKANSVYISATSSVTSDIWQYSLDNGSSWVQFSTSAGTNATKTITGLSPNSLYQVKVRARKQSNGVYGASATTSVTTLGATLLNSVSDFPVDVDSPSFNINWTVYDKSYTHSLTIKNGSTTILTITGLTGSAGTNNKAITLTSEQRLIVLNAMASTSSLSVAYVLTTYNGDTLIGSTSQITGNISTSESLSAPDFTDFEYSGSCAEITGSADLCLQSEECPLVIKCTPAKARNGASIAYYEATICDTTVLGKSFLFSFGTIEYSGELTLTVSAVDSRGFKTSVSKIITVLPYTPVHFTSYSIRRKNNVEDLIQLDFSGSISRITIGEETKNDIVSITYRVKEATDIGWFNDPQEVEGVINEGNTFSFASTDWLSLPNTKAYYVELKVTDKLEYDKVELYINKGQPLVAFRESKVGINTNEPLYALDVNGDVAMNGYRVQGYVGELDDNTDLDTVTASGIYYIAPGIAIENQPLLNTPGMLEVIELNTSFCVQKIVYAGGASYKRCRFDNVWDDWT